ncbi:DUF6099 family protein [Streptomyces sp. AM 4-1-1]|uniref:DUF6099 family protein n=1 Tax=Streptomyces sp. AM 4-1-1 TaxID=3028710 RepID=UPI0023BA24C6|nr:DUF6099 family protein [Streptomyces sp. AM 4-1-1]WEH36390.1 DUF6099 family protein [Streptomyces sp. AM 4-1-1]
MEAERLVGVSRRALADCRGALETLTEAWQAQALAQAIGGRLALCGPPELRGEAFGLDETGGRGGGGSLDHPVVGPGGARAAQLSEVADPRATLTALGELLGEVGTALVAVACATDEEGYYWQSIEAIDAADESMDRVHGMLRRLAERDRGRDRDRERNRVRDRDQARGGGLPRAGPDPGGGEEAGRPGGAGSSGAGPGAVRGGSDSAPGTGAS